MSYMNFVDILTSRRLRRCKYEVSVCLTFNSYVDLLTTHNDINLFIVSPEIVHIQMLSKHASSGIVIVEFVRYEQ
jgi:hypothetical protein